MKKILYLVFIFLPTFSWAKSELTLAKLVSLTLKNHPQILSLLGQYESLKGQVRQRRGLYDWSASASASYSDVDQRAVVIFSPSNTKTASYAFGLDRAFSFGTTINAFSTIIRTQDNSSFSVFPRRYESTAGINVEQSLLQGFLGLPNRKRLNADKERLAAIESQLWRDVEVLVANVARLYWSLWRDQQLLDVARQSQLEARSFYNETKRLKKLGLRETDEVLQADVSWLARQQETLEAQTLVQNSWTALKKELKLQNDDKWVELPLLEEPSWEPIERTASDLLRLAYRNRADLIATERTYEANKKVVKGLKTNSLPNLTATGGYSLVGLDPKFSESWDQVNSSQFPGWNVGIALQHSFGQNIDRSEQHFAQADLYQSQALYETTHEAVQSETQISLRNFQLNLKRLGLAKSVEEKREKIQKAFKRKFSQGRIAIQDLLQSQENLRRARYQRQIFESAMAIAEIDLLLAMGRYLMPFTNNETNIFSYLDERTK